jgi:hypothetical protein
MFDNDEDMDEVVTYLKNYKIEPILYSKHLTVNVNNQTAWNTPVEVRKEDPKDSSDLVMECMNSSADSVQDKAFWDTPGKCVLSDI